jgi:hypothetical protein
LSVLVTNHGRSGSDDDVATQHELEAPGQRYPVHSGDHGLWELLKADDDVSQRLQEGSIRTWVVRNRLDVSEVRPGAERPSRPRKHHDARAIQLVHEPKLLGADRPEHFGVHGIEPLGTRERDPTNTVTVLDIDAGSVDHRNVESWPPTDRICPLR